MKAPASHVFVAPDAPIDLSNCDREPIHIPGAIQPHGVLLALRDSSDELRVVQASANASLRLGRNRPILGAPLADVLGDEATDKIREALGRGSTRASITIDTLAGSFDATVHRSGGVAVLELESADASASLAPDAFRDMLRETLIHIEGATSLPALARSIAAQMRRLTGFDRVWVYRFHEDWHGEIIGESMREGIEPWLGLHYPASDIPAQARALFLKNWLRMIPHVAYTRVPLEPVNDPQSAQPLDLGNAVLRAVSPIHIEYLTNMGVTASLVISLINRGQLWGLISGHHYSGPKHVPLATRTLCEFLAQALSVQVGLAEQVEHRELALSALQVGRQLRERLSQTEDYRLVLTHGSPNLLDLTRSGGAVVCDDENCTSVGRVPTPDQVRALLGWLRGKHQELYHTTSLSREYPPAAAWTEFASGLLAVAVSPKRPYYILWFRPERRQTIRWAGNPNKPVTTDDVTGAPRLSPRGSFAAWEEEMLGTSEPWARVDVDAAADLRRTLLDQVLARAEEMHAALGREREARDEADRANRAKFEFLAMMSHELRTPLNAIGGYAQMLEMGVRGPISEPQILDLHRIQQNQRHLLGLINNILNFAKLDAGQVSFDIVDLDFTALLDELESLVLPQLTEKRLRFELKRPVEKLVARADMEKSRQVLLNLLTNAIKFTAEGGSIIVTARREGDTLVTEVTDTGRGIPVERLSAIFEPFVQVARPSADQRSEGIGLGLAISRDLARRMHGDLIARSTLGKGSTFTFTLPSSQS
jgi:light-regulated signal transduction histidine kinase (bacteriophytochrome)